MRRRARPLHESDREAGEAGTEGVQGMRWTTLCSMVCLTALVGTSVAYEKEKPDTTKRPRVFVVESESWSMGSELNPLDFGDFSEITGGARPQTAEIVKTMHDRCPEVIVTRKEDRADFVLVLEHEGGKILVRKDNKYALYNAEGDAIASGATRLLGNSVKEACSAIRAAMVDREPER